MMPKALLSMSEPFASPLAVISAPSAAARGANQPPTPSAEERGERFNGGSLLHDLRAKDRVDAWRLRATRLRRHAHVLREMRQATLIRRALSIHMAGGLARPRARREGVKQPRKGAHCADEVQNHRRTVKASSTSGDHRATGARPLASRKLTVCKKSSDGHHWSKRGYSEVRQCDFVRCLNCGLVREFPAAPPPGSADAG
jgi:hypothetical protein